jgi:hypothetical protein
VRGAHLVEVRVDEERDLDLRVAQRAHHLSQVLALAFSTVLLYTGMPMVTKMPMTTIAITISITVKFFRIFSLLLNYQLL